MNKGVATILVADELIKYIRSLDDRITIFLSNESKIRIYEHIFALIALGYFANKLSNLSVDQVKKTVWRWSKKLFPSYHLKIANEIGAEVDKVIKDSFPPIQGLEEQRSLPQDGLSNKEVMRRLKLLHDSDVDIRKGQLFAYVYPTNEKHEKLVVDAQNMFIHLNALNPTAFPSLRRMEVEVVQMAINMLNGDSLCRGTMTSGGTESILMAMKAYRDYALENRGISKPEVVLPISAHPAFEKAAKYFGIKLRYIELVTDDNSHRVNIEKMKRAINRNTILLVASAPQYPHGILDPVEELAKIAKSYSLPLHVDACIGGFFLPFLESAGYKLPCLFDFRVDGVTSISADIHKYGYATKGSSVILFKSDDYRKYQFMAYTGWPGGIFVSPSVLGTRAGGNIAAAWTSIVSLGHKGFQSNVANIMKTSKAIQEGIKSIKGIQVIGNPVMSIIAFCASPSSGADPLLNIHAVADVMQSKYGWKLERQHKPSCIHMTLTPSHVGIESTFIGHLQDAVQVVLGDPSLANKGSAAMYNGISNIPLTQIADDFLIDFMAKTYTL
ncbi:sphingosine-1-phosphate lyase [Cavenderia fasciculata]|uniref:sphinganine-1-phosphate aldolase n=1 Tax=Cavenderia fasciculata TaxID=261658 RepID=F4Q2P5_CACFS|nr:sphingosine-1-phosphate lyase [Cavenderia fasciculata]EGG17512.1 sphingosine-1-phosphate lyase [Cavenderia fasciculata]|eukprot:XP_004355996.1 sphingosine-1-phosphate lyase [Cavenderia fasciculata]